MRSIIASVSLLLLLAVTMAPFYVVLEFHADRARIARELCVQRELTEGMRTCHGECQLSKRLAALEEEAEAGFPAERIMRYEPVVDVAPGSHAMIDQGVELLSPDPVFLLSDGFGRGMEHVPLG